MTTTPGDEADEWVGVNPDVLAQLAAYIGTGADDPALLPSYAVAQALLAETLEYAWRQPSVVVLDQLTVEVASEVYARRNSPSGSSQFASLEGGQPVRGPRDPLARVWPILRRYVRGFR